MKKENLNLHVMWHIDAVLHQFPVTIVTTTETAGKINAATFFPVVNRRKNPTA